LKQLPHKAVGKLIHLYNAAFRLKYVPSYWKAEEVIMLLKPEKLATEVTSHRPISLLPVLSKLFQKLILERLKPIIEEKQIIPNHQFGFRDKHPTIDQVHKITTIIEKAIEERQVCSIVFLDVAQAFDTVWHERLFYKLEQLLPTEYNQILKSYLSERYFHVTQEDEYSGLKPIKGRCATGKCARPGLVLYLIYTSDIPQPEGITVTTFANDSHHGRRR
jgi:hypothetical protein